MKLKANLKKLRNREGSALLIALMALAGLSILGLSLMLVADTEVQISNDERLRKQALFAAEAGIEHALIYLRGIDTERYGTDGANPGVLSGNNGFDWGTPAQPPDELNSYNDPIVKTENLYDPAKPWMAPALSRKGNILYFCTTCTPAWYKTGYPKPNMDYAMRDVDFEENAGAGAQFDVNTFKSRYTVYVKNNLDDPAALDDPGNILTTEPLQYEFDQDERLVLTSEGIVDVGTRGSTGGVGYKVTRTVQVTIETSQNVTCDDYAGAGGHGGTGNRTNCDEVPIISPQPRSGQVKRNVDWN